MPTVTLTVNGAVHRVDADANLRLLDLIRNDLNLTGTKYGCGEGQCGSCTVLIDGEAVRSCTTRVSALDGKQVTTIEALEKDGRLHPVQEAFLAHDAFQCAFCTTGMIMAAVGLLAKNPAPDAAAIVKGMDHNVCRCGTYPRIVAAIQDAARAMRSNGR